MFAGILSLVGDWWKTVHTNLTRDLRQKFDRDICHIAETAGMDHLSRRRTLLHPPSRETSEVEGVERAAQVVRSRRDRSERRALAGT